jgi:hypothetical protein
MQSTSQQLVSAPREQVPPHAPRVVAIETQTVHDAGEEVAVCEEAV